MECLRCHKDNPSDGRFCIHCGTVLAQCPRCGAVTPPESKFCGSCGLNLAENALAPPDLETTSNGNRPGGERRHLTVLFCDLVGSTMLAKSLDPEELNEITRSYYDCCTNAIQQFDGLVANYIGDGVMALFGYPRAYEDGAERAIHAALAILRAMRTVSARSKTELNVRIGIATGLVVVGEAGSGPLTKEKSVVGEAPNLAAHIQSKASPNHILISNETRRLVGDVFKLRSVQLADLKSASEPVTVWRVVEKNESTSRFAAAHLLNITAFVGREQEVALLNDRWMQAVQGEGEVVLLSGEAGIGKSRIVETFSQLIAGESRFTIHCQCSPYHFDSALHPIIRQIEHAANITAGNSQSARLDKLEVMLRRRPPPLEAVVPLFAALLSIPTGDRYPPTDPDPHRLQDRILSALVDQLAGLAQVRPVLIILEDVHWADPTTFDLVGRIVLRLAETRVLLIMTCRPEFKSRWAGHPQLTALSLNRLGRRHCQTMVHSIAGKSLPPDVMEQIIAKTDGVPLFVEELTKTVLKSALLRETDGAWLLDRSFPTLSIPATLQDSLMARLDRLSSVKEVAQVAATIGREFSYALLARVSALPETEIRVALAKLTSAELIFPQGTPPAASYLFKHALVCDAAYETLLKSKRNQLHGRIAHVLATEFAEIAEAQPELLAHHYTQAGLTSIAIQWWQKSADLAIRRSANREAVGHLGRALGLIRLLPSTPERDRTELALRIALSGPLIATRGYVTSALAENYSKAAELCTKLGEDKDVFAVMYGQWVIPYVRGDMAAALRNSERFLSRAEKQDDVGLLMMGHRIHGSSLVWRGDTVQGSEHLKRALSMYRPEHDKLAYIFSQHPRTAALAHLCLALQHVGYLDQAMTTGWEAITEAKRIEHFNSIAYSLCFVSLLIMLRQDLNSLKQTAGELLMMAEQHNADYWALWARPMLGWIKAEEGDSESGLQEMHESTAKLQERGAMLWVPQSLLLQAEILGRTGQFESAYRQLDEAQALIEQYDQRYYEAELHRVRGTVILSERGNLDAVAVNFDRAIEVARRQSSRFLELRATTAKARLLNMRGARKGAHDILAPVCNSFTEGLETADLVTARLLLDELE